MNRTLKHHFDSFTDKKYTDYLERLGSELVKAGSLGSKEAFLRSQENLSLTDYLISFVRNVGRMADDSYGDTAPQLERLYSYDEQWTKVRDSALKQLRDGGLLDELGDYSFFTEQFFRMKNENDYCAESVSAMYKGLECYQNEVSITKDKISDDELFRKLYGSQEPGEISDALSDIERIDDSVYTEILLGLKKYQSDNAARLGYENPRFFVDDNYQISHEMVDHIEKMIVEVGSRRVNTTEEILKCLFISSNAEGRCFTIDEAFELVRSCMGEIIPGMGDMIARARAEYWVDWEPRRGKLSGSYTNILHFTGESIITVTFGGTVKDVCKLAHELGHAYHGSLLAGEKYFNTDFSVITAEAFALFCEYYVLVYLQRQTGDSIYAEILKEAVRCTWYTNSIFYRFEKRLFEELSGSDLSVSGCCRRAVEEILGENATKEMPGLGNIWISRSQNFFPEYYFYNIVYMIGEYYALWMLNAIDSRQIQAGDIDEMLKRSGKESVDSLFDRLGVSCNAGEYEMIIDWLKS